MAQDEVSSNLQNTDNLQGIKIIVKPPIDDIETEREHNNIKSSTNDDSNSINDSNSQLPKIIQVQPLNMAQDEVSSNLQNTVRP